MSFSPIAHMVRASRDPWSGLGTIALAIVLSQGHAWAADPDPVGAASDTTVSSTKAADDIEEVVVTARRKKERAQDVPIPMTVFSGAALDSEGVHSVQELQQKLPSTNIIVNSPRMSSYAVRGVGATTIANEGLESSTGLYLDGVYLAKTGMAIVDLNDIDQVELLRGPQGTLFGKNTTTGAFNFTTRKPTFTPEFSSDLTIGTYNDVEFRGSASGPLVDDKLAGRLTLYKVDREGFLDDPATGKHPNTRNREGFRTQFLGVPSDDLSIRVIAEYHKDDYPQGFAPTLYSVPPNATFFNRLNQMKAAGYNVLPVSRDPYSFSTTATHRDQNTEQKALTTQLDWTLGGGYDFTSISSYRGWDFTPANDGDFMNLPIALCCGMGDRQKQFTQELRISSPKGREVETTAGLYYFWQSQRAYTETVYGTDPTLLSIWLGVTQPVAAARYAGRTSRVDSALTTNSYAAFTQSDWHVTDKVTLTGGLRETYEEKSIGLTRDLGGTSATLPNLQSVSNSIANWNLSGTLAVAYKPVESLTLFGSYAKGAKSGTLSNAPRAGVALDAGELVVKPEKINDFELGFKSDLLDRRIQLNGSLFYALIQDYQTNVANIDPTTNQAGLRLSNANWVRTRGAELETTIKLVQGLSVTANGAYNDAVFRSFHNAPCPSDATNAATSTCDITGRALMGASRWTGTVSATYSVPVAEGFEAYINPSFTYRTGYYGSVDLSNYGWIDGYGIANLRVGARTADGAADVSLWARNLFDNNYYTAMGTTVNGAWFGYVGDPLTLGLTTRFKI